MRRCVHLRLTYSSASLKVTFQRPHSSNFDPDPDLPDPVFESKLTPDDFGLKTAAAAAPIKAAHTGKEESEKLEHFMWRVAQVHPSKQ